MKGRGSGHVTCGPMRGLKINFTGRGQTDKRTDERTLQLSDWIGLGADSVKRQVQKNKGKGSQFLVIKTFVYPSLQIKFLSKTTKNSYRLVGVKILGSKVKCFYLTAAFKKRVTLAPGRIKVHGGVPLELRIYFDILQPGIDCLVIRHRLTVLFLNPES